MDIKKCFEVQELSHKYNNAIETSKWIGNIPFLDFPSDWKIQPLPNFGGAMARFRVKKGERIISVYLDCYDILGYYGSPYWEIYPYIDGNTERYNIDDIEGFLKGLNDSLNK